MITISTLKEVFVRISVRVICMASCKILEISIIFSLIAHVAKETRRLHNNHPNILDCITHLLLCIYIFFIHITYVYHLLNVTTDI